MLGGSKCGLLAAGGERSSPVTVIGGFVERVRSAVAAMSVWRRYSRAWGCAADSFGMGGRAVATQCLFRAGFGGFWGAAGSRCVAAAVLRVGTVGVVLVSGRMNRIVRGRLLLLGVRGRFDSIRGSVSSPVLGGIRRRGHTCRLTWGFVGWATLLLGPHFRPVRGVDDPVWPGVAWVVSR